MAVKKSCDRVFYAGSAAFVAPFDTDASHLFRPPNEKRRPLFLADERETGDKPEVFQGSFNAQT